MRRRFSFDIPRLKIGPSKADNKLLADRLAANLNSPPPTPKSVRPPLNPQVDAELRSACAYVLQNYKPSSQVFQEQQAASQTQAQPGPKPQLDYTTIKETVHRDVGQPFLQPHSHETGADASSTGPLPDDGASSDRYRYRPDDANQDLVQCDDISRLVARRNAALRLDQIMAPTQLRAPSSTAGQYSAPHSHSRTLSSPIEVALSPQKSNLNPTKRPQTSRRTDSVDTTDTGSTPQTEATDYWGVEKTSTAMTSAAMTPARGSKRTSSQPMQSDSERSSMPKLDAIDAEWMRQELDKHRRAQEERVRADIAQQDAVAADAGDNKNPPRAPMPNFSKRPSRKAVPMPKSEKRQEPEPLPSNNGPNSPRMHPGFLESNEAPHSENSRGRHRTLSPSRQHGELSRTRSRARSITRGVKQYFRSDSTPKPAPVGDSSAPPSRAKSLTRQVKEIVRPRTATESNKSSQDISRAGSRSFSVNSFRSEASAMTPSVTSSTNAERAWKSSHRHQDSVNNSEISRPGSSNSNFRSHGHSRQSSSQQRASAAVDLNRHLPPLPGLDQWKSAELAGPKQILVKHSTAQTPNTTDRPRHPRKSQPGWPMVASGQPLEAHHTIAARTTTPPAHRSRTLSNSRPAQVVLVPPQPTATPPPDLSFYGSDDYDLEHLPLKPTTTIDPSYTHLERRQERQYSRKTALPNSGLEESTQPATVFSAPLRKRASTTGKPVNYSRITPLGLAHENVDSASNTPSDIATGRDIPFSPPSSDGEHLITSHRVSMDDYSRMYDSRFQHMVEISPANTHAASAPPPRKEKAKRKWWRSNKSDRPEPTWMEEVLRSGSNRGMILIDETAGAPIVRY